MMDSVDSVKQLMEREISLQWEIAMNKPEFKQNLEAAVGHEFTEKDLALLRQMFINGGVFWFNYMAEVGKLFNL